MKLGGIAAAGDFWKVIREFNPEGIEREATAPLDVWVVGQQGVGKHTLAGSLLADGVRAGGWGPFRILDVDLRQDLLLPAETPDLVILVVRVDQDLAELGGNAAALFGRMRTPLLLVFTHADAVPNTRELRNAAYRAFSFVSHLRTVYIDARDSAEVQAKLLPLLLEAVPKLRTPLARQIPLARPYVAEQIIAETCRVNAQFALAANLPANLPLIGGVAGNIADFFVLTKNQAMMVFRLAAIYGRDISFSRRVIAEILPVIGGGFVWRTAARMAAGMLPTFLAAAPKTAIAYVGTYVAGEAARYYYDEGRRPSRELLRRFSFRGVRLYRGVLEGPGGSWKVVEGSGASRSPRGPQVSPKTP